MESDNTDEVLTGLLRQCAILAGKIKQHFADLEKDKDNDKFNRLYLRDMQELSILERMVKDIKKDI
jgi:hypothetical protein